MTNKDVKNYLPLTPSAYQILLALSGKKELHGFGIMKEAEEATGERIPNPTLYRSIAKILDAGLIEIAREEENGRRFYKISNIGMKVVSAEATRLWRLANQAREKQLIPGLA